LLPDDQVHPDTHVLTMVNNVIGVVNYVIAARPSLLNFVIADTVAAEGQYPRCRVASGAGARTSQSQFSLSGDADSSWSCRKRAGSILFFAAIA
jgi:hypothetical protein